MHTCMYMYMYMHTCCCDRNSRVGAAGCPDNFPHSSSSSFICTGFRFFSSIPFNGAPIQRYTSTASSLAWGREESEGEGEGEKERGWRRENERERERETEEEEVRKREGGSVCEREGQREREGGEKD